METDEQLEWARAVHANAAESRWEGVTFGPMSWESAPSPTRPGVMDYTITMPFIEVTLGPPPPDLDAIVNRITVITPLSDRFATVREMRMTNPELAQAVDARAKEMGCNWPSD